MPALTEPTQIHKTLAKVASMDANVVQTIILVQNAFSTITSSMALKIVFKQVVQLDITYPAVSVLSADHNA